MFTMGQDFTFQNAAMYFKNLDKLIKHMNERTGETGINLLYSTPSCYLRAMNEAGEAAGGDFEWPTKTDDFFPHANGELVCLIHTARNTKFR